MGLFFPLAVAFVAPLLASLVPKFIYRQGLSAKANHIMLGISAGLLFAIATLDLVPEAFSMTAQASFSAPSTHANESGHDHGSEHGGEGDHGHDHGDEEHPSRIAMIGVGAGYLVLLIVEQILTNSGHSHSHGTPLQINDLDVRRELEETHAHSHGDRHGGDSGGSLSESFSTVALVALALHCLVDGFVMAGAYEASAEVGARVALALIVHKIPDGFVLSAVLSASRSNASFFSTVAFLAAMTPLGGLLGYVLMGGISPQVLGFVLGFGAGTFLFITATGIIPEIMSKETPRGIRNWSLISMVAAYAGFFLFDSFFHAH